MNAKNITLFILGITVCLSLFACKPEGIAQELDPIELQSLPEPPGEVITETGSIDPNIDEQLQTLLEQGGIPSFTVGIVVEDELVWAKSYNGVAGTDTVYVVGSVTKPFIATAVLQLYERGHLDLETDINEYLPFPVRHPKFPDKPITVSMLLTHQSGLAHETEDLRRFLNSDENIFRYVKASVGLDLPELKLHPQPTSAEFFEAHLTPGGIYYTKDIWPQEPGTYLYSNVGYSLLSYLIECVADQPVEPFLREYIFDPLEMDLSGAELAGLAANHAPPYLRIQGDFIFIPFRGIPISRLCKASQVKCITRNLTKPGGYYPVPEDIKQKLEGGYLRFPLSESILGSGGLRTTVPDLAKFMIAHMNQGLAPNGHQLLQPDTVTLMHQLAASDDGSINMIPLEGYGMGWTLAEDGIQGHIGGAFGYEAEMLYKESSQGSYGIIFLRNWSWELADDYKNGKEYWLKYHVGVREILMEEAGRLHQEVAGKD